jgi:hypothetical protein
MAGEFDIEKRWPELFERLSALDHQAVVQTLANGWHEGWEPGRRRPGRPDARRHRPRRVPASQQGCDRARPRLLAAMGKRLKASGGAPETAVARCCRSAPGDLARGAGRVRTGASVLGHRTLQLATDTCRIYNSHSAIWS